MLKIRFRDGRRSAVTLGALGKTIGKGSVNDIVIDNVAVSGFHADVKVQGGEVTITDVDTATGTLVNGARIRTATPLRAGDLITIGGVDLEVFEVSDEGARTMVLSGKALIESGDRCWALIADSGVEKGQVIPVMDQTEIGRALSCDISILEPVLSRKHAELLPHGNKLLLCDLGSTNGSMVNGEKVEAALLRDRDVLQFGRMRFIVRGP